MIEGGRIRSIAARCRELVSASGAGTGASEAPQDGGEASLDRPVNPVSPALAWGLSLPVAALYWFLAAVVIPGLIREPDPSAGELSFLGFAAVHVAPEPLEQGRYLLALTAPLTLLAIYALTVRGRAGAAVRLHAGAHWTLAAAGQAGLLARIASGIKGRPR